MKNIFAAIFAKLGKGQGAQHNSAQTGKEVAAGLRSMVFTRSPAEIGITPQSFPYQAWGIVMETGMKAGYYTLVAVADGTTSLYFSNGGGIIGAGEKPEIREVSKQFITVGNRFIESSKPATTFQAPSQGSTKFFFLTFIGVRSYEAAEIELGENRDSLAPLFHAGHAVITAIRQSQSKV